MKVWEVIAELSKRPAGEDVRVCLAGEQDTVVDLVRITIESDGDQEHWPVLQGEDPAKYDL